jgi:hypothetical protein
MTPEVPSPMVPLLPLDETRLDADVLATWHMALSGSLATDLPHDLLALWLYTPAGPVLVGPEALAADGLVPPPAAPHVASDAVEQFAGIFERAQYLETLVQPVAYGRSDVGLLVCASFAPSDRREARRDLLLDVAQQLAPMLARLARQWAQTEVQTREVGATADGASLLDALNAVTPHDATPAGLLQPLLRALDAALPHDAAVLLVPGTLADSWYRLSEHRTGPLWQDPACHVEDHVLRALGLATERAAVLSGAADPAAWTRLLPELNAVPASVLSVPLQLGHRYVGQLVLAAADPDRYAGSERRLASAVAPYLAARTEALLLAADAATARARSSALQAVPVQLGQLAALLAARPDTAEAMREFAAEATSLLPLRQLRFAVRLGAHDRVALVTPGETRAFADLPSQPITGTPLAEVLSGERPWGRIVSPVLVEHAFPLRVSGEIIGALLVGLAPNESLSRMHLALAQQLADLLAPHLELQRRPYVRPPFVPGWKRIETN